MASSSFSSSYCISFSPSPSRSPSSPPPFASSPLCLCRLSSIIVTTPHYLFFPTVALALFLYISLRGTRCVPRMIYSGADILAESMCCGQDALFLLRCLKMVPTLISDANELLYIYLHLLHHHCGHNLIYLLFCL